MASTVERRAGKPVDQKGDGHDRKSRPEADAEFHAWEAARDLGAPTQQKPSAPAASSARRHFASMKASAATATMTPPAEQFPQECEAALRLELRKNKGIERFTISVKG